MGLKAINHTFQTHPRTPKLSRKNNEIPSPSPPALRIKTSKCNFSANTGHIYTLKHGPENWELHLSDTPKNAKIEQEIPIKIMTFPPHLFLP